MPSWIPRLPLRLLIHIIKLLLQAAEAHARRVTLHAGAPKIKDRVVPLQELGANQREPTDAAVVDGRLALVARLVELVAAQGEGRARGGVLVGAKREGQGPRRVHVPALHALLAGVELGEVPAEVEVDGVDDLGRDRDAAGARVEDGAAGVVGPGRVGFGVGAGGVVDGGEQAVAHRDGRVGVVRREDVDGADGCPPELVGVFLREGDVNHVAVDVFVLVAGADAEDAVLRARVVGVGAVEESEARGVELVLPEERLDERGRFVLCDGGEA